MSENDQILGNVGGEEATASGSVDNGAAPQPTNSSSVDDGAVDNGAAGNTPRPDNQSVPPASGACRLTALPIELLRLVTANLDPIGYRGVRISSKSLRQQLDAPPPMTFREYAEFQKQLEAHSSRKLKNLFCSFCNHFKARTPSRKTFTDAQAVHDHSGRRACIECGVNNGHYDKRDVVIKKKKFFACGGCKHVLPQDEEDRVVADVVTTKGYPYRDTAWGQGAEITFGSGGKRWCRRCRASLENLGGSGAMKLRQTRGGRTARTAKRT